MTEPRTRKIGEIEALFRGVNEQIEELSETFSVAAETMTIVCECGNRECVEQFEITVREYEDIRANASLFFVLPGHEEDDVERVVQRTDRYWVVSKHDGAPARIASETDPRS